MVDLRTRYLYFWSLSVITLVIICYLSLYQPDVPPPPCSELTTGAGLPYTDNPVISLSSLAALSPHSSPHPACSPPTLPPIPSCGGQPGLTGEILPSERRVVLMMMFGFEVDTLEVSLREQLDMVDTVFLVEATTTTKGVSITRTILKN